MRGFASDPGSLTEKHNMDVPEYPLGSIYDFEDMEAIAVALQGKGGLQDKFETEFAEYCGASYAMATVSGTMALHLATAVLRLGPQDEVICTPQTFLATLLPLIERRVRVVFADIEPETLCIDPNTIEDRITDRTRAIYVMHYGGLPCDMDPIMEMAERHGLYVVEDAAHAPGAEYKGRRIGSIAHLTCFSFGSLKNMTTLGQGGMITTHCEELDSGLRAMRGRELWGDRIEKQEARIGPYPQPGLANNDNSGDAYTHDWIEVWGVGHNIPMTDVQASVGSVQLRKLDRMNGIRRELAERYTRGLTQVDGISVQPHLEGRESVYHLYPFFIDQERTGIRHDDLIRALEANNIRIKNRFFPCHLGPAMRMMGHEPGEAPVCERVWFEQQINLPISPLHTPQQIDYVVEMAHSLIKSR
jgi:perosamine synthetase